MWGRINSSNDEATEEGWLRETGMMGRVRLGQWAKKN
jgi:hypothetical protein